MATVARALAHLAHLKRLRPRSRAEALRLLACLIMGGLAGLLLVPRGQGGSGLFAGAPSSASAPVTLDGKPLVVTDDPQKVLDAARAIAREYVAVKVALSAGGGDSAALRRTREELGARVEPERLASLVAQAADPKSPLWRTHRNTAAGSPLNLPLPVSVDGARALAALLSIKDEVDRAPVDAKLDIATHRVRPDEPGRRVDVYATLARVDAALTKGDVAVEAVVESVPAARTAAQIGDVQLDDVLGYFETKYARDMKHEARSFNLKLAASKLDGHVVMPGETFDFNEVVGPRNEVNGYKVATVIAQGELADGIGGGTCQIAGTLHGAAFFAGLDIVERKPHTRPSFYIKMGMDAAVVYPTITLRLRNPFSFPIVLHETVREGVVRAEIVGAKRTRDVTFVRKINEVTPFQEREVSDPKIPKGERVLSQRGIPGFKITRYRILRDGPFAVRERMQDVYPSTAQIWKVGAGETDSKFVARDDEHPEYVADEYLLVSQGPHVVSPRTLASSPSSRAADASGPREAAPERAERGGPTVESRVAGRYGTHGWTVREGFAKAEGTRSSRPERSRDHEEAPGVD